jgi:type II pantothenate kinase
MDVDLIVIEGVGRSIHSNFNAKFKCPSLKLAVIKVIKIEQNF